MRILAAIILFGYAQLVIHQAGHGHGIESSVHVHLEHANPFVPDHTRKHASSERASHTHPHSDEHGEDHGDGDHEHGHYAHQHRPLISRAPQADGFDAPPPPMLAFDCGSLDPLLRLPTAARPSGFHSPPRGPTYLHNLVLRI